MSTFQKLVVGFLSVALVIVLVTSFSNRSVVTKGVTIGSEYHATTTYSKLGTPLFGVKQTILSNVQGTLGSVIITGAVAGSMSFMDATSSTDISSTTVAVFPASLAAGTYTFDTVLTRGLIVESTASLLPTTTITFRSN